MQLALDHLVVICDPGAPQAQSLIDLGLTEGSANTHTGQGTANRRFFFRNAYVELLWVDDLALSRREPAFRTRLWERWMRRREGACPLGIALRPADPRDAEEHPAFATWAYHAPYLAPQVSIGIAVNSPLTEPEILYVNFATSPASKNREPLDHQLGVKEITGLRIGVPGDLPQAAAAKAVAASGLAEFFRAADYVAEVLLDGAVHQRSADLRPGLPLIFRY
ncbi:MAG: VOC family protein [Candidatus Eremiobacteraeota bacterium]|nr:VOC family protein [Candidatus Eremiobacteraeota bacterium]